MALTTDDGEKRLGFTVTGPVSDTVRMRLTVAKSDYDGNLKNLTTGKNVNGSSGLTATAKIEWTPHREPQAQPWRRGSTTTSPAAAPARSPS